MYTVDDQTITRPLLKIDTPAAGFYALTGESVLSFPPNQEKEQICDCFEKIREQNPLTRILLVLDNFSSHVCAHTRERAHELGIDLASSFSRWAHRISTQSSRSGKVSSGSFHPLIVDGAVFNRALLDEIFTKLTDQLSFASS